jgi:hypothetical protein
MRKRKLNPARICLSEGHRRVSLSVRWRDGRVAEGAGLLNRYTAKSRIGGSNPPLSATSVFVTDSDKERLFVIFINVSSANSCFDELHTDDRRRNELTARDKILVNTERFHISTPPHCVERCVDALDDGFFFSSVFWFFTDKRMRATRNCAGPVD